MGMTMERTGLITFKGIPLTLAGSPVTVGNKAPDFTVLNVEMNPVTLAAFKDKIVILTSVPSLDTPVCDREVRRFNEAALKLSGDIAVAAISMDLPFAQGRWCGSAGVKRVLALSDHRDAAFGLAYGVLIKEWRLLARAIFVIDRTGIVRYSEIVNEITREPDYDAVLKTVAGLK